MFKACKIQMLFTQAACQDGRPGMKNVGTHSCNCTLLSLPTWNRLLIFNSTPRAPGKFLNNPACCKHSELPFGDHCLQLCSLKNTNQVVHKTQMLSNNLSIPKSHPAVLNFYFFGSESQAMPAHVCPLKSTMLILHFLHLHAKPSHCLIFYFCIF